MLTIIAETINATAAGRKNAPMNSIPTSMNQIGTEQYTRQSTPKPHSAGLAHADRAPRGQANQVARPVSATGISSSIISSNPKYRMNGPGE